MMQANEWREEIEAEIDQLLRDLNDLQENVDYSEPGIYYEYLDASGQIERRIQRLIRQLEAASEE